MSKSFHPLGVPINLRMQGMYFAIILKRINIAICSNSKILRKIVGCEVSVEITNWQNYYLTDLLLNKF